jgi:CubicO group peptidase (beta-lactamase class C family)
MKPDGRKLCAVTLAVLASSLGSSGCVSIPSQATIARRADALMSDLHTRGQFNGAIVLGRDGDIVYEGALGPANVEAGAAWTPDTSVEIASLVKTFTAAAVWMLVEEGKLEIDAPVQRYLPQYPHAGTTVRHLLAHSAGLGDYDQFDDLAPPEIVTPERMIDALHDRGFQPLFAPGSCMEYCNVCFDLAGLIVARVSGQSWEHFLRERIFLPLGMRSTFQRPARFADHPGVRTLSYRIENGVLTLDEVADNDGTLGLCSSARDLHRWATSFYRQPALGPCAMSEGLEAVVLKGGERSALNFLNWYHSEDGQRCYFSGHYGGFHHEVYWDARRGHSFAWVSNASPEFPLPAKLNRALIDILEGRAPEPVMPLGSGGPGESDSLDSIAGTYELESVGSVTVSVKGDRTFLRINEGCEREGFGRNGFYVPGLDAFINFSDVRDGRYQRIRWNSVFRVASGNRIELPGR